MKFANMANNFANPGTMLMLVPSTKYQVLSTCTGTKFGKMKKEEAV